MHTIGATGPANFQDCEDKMVCPLVRTWLTQDYLKSLLNYDPNTGRFTWLVHRGRARAGSVAVAFRGDLLFVRLHGVLLPYADLAWLWMTGELPDDDSAVLYLDGNTMRTAWHNLRLVPKSANS